MFINKITERDKMKTKRIFIVAPGGSIWIAVKGYIINGKDWIFGIPDHCK